MPDQLTETRISKPGNSLAGALNWFADSLNARPRLYVFSFFACGLLVRVVHASGTYLHPDEALHFAIANKASWIDTYRASLSLSHPPLLIFLLHAWRALGTSELWLRVPSIFAGMLFCWLTFKWLGKLFSPAVAWTAFVFLLFLSSSIDLSTEIRQYALLLAFCMGAAYLLEQAFDKDSAIYMLGSGLCLFLAIGSHYSAFLFAAVLGLYAVSRIVRHHPSLKVIAAWEAGVIASAALAYFFYVTHLATLGQRYGGGSATHAWMAGSYLGNSYYVPGKVNWALFIFARTGSVFQYIFGQSVVGDFAVFAFAAGVFLALKYNRLLTRFQLCVLLLLPYALNCAAGLLRLYPYGGTRHSSFLIPFAIAGISIALVRESRNGVGIGMISALVICMVCNLFPSHRENIAANHRLSDMAAAMNFIHNQVPPQESLFADYESGLILGYYLCESRPVQTRHMQEFVTFECGGHQVIAADWNNQVFTLDKFRRTWPKMIASFDIPENSHVWVAQMGIPAKLHSQLNQPSSSDYAFGPNINIFSLEGGARTP